MFAVLFLVYVRWEKQIDVANETRQQSFLLSSELRQTSDELTRMVRSYVATGDIRYKQYYQEILDIRNGVAPRPKDYRYVYWDLAVADARRQSPRDPAVSLLELMRRSGFTPAEFAKLAQAQVHSDKLTATEFSAIALFESSSPPSEAQRTQALQLLYDPPYHQAKSRIMQPIHDFQRMMDLRTLEAVRLAEHRAALVRTVFVLFGLMLIVIQWRAYRTLHTVLGGALDELHELINRLRGGDFHAITPVPPGREDSVMAWLVDTQAALQRQQAEREQLEQELRDLAFHDALTQLPNRRQLLDRLKHASASSKRHNSHGAVLFLDLNKFKALNDTHGHEVGDQLLVQVAQRLRLATRENDTVARLGGDEFVVLLEDLGPDAAQATAYATQVAHKIALALAEEYTLGQVHHQGSASIGIGLFLSDTADPDAIIKTADAAMYQNKKQRAP
ncbi:GGDEF domain-containing protein [Oxalobacteraceae bacterium]|nr:GGDEF domain-containing protein [Oxalobacteraceae bacterium]